MTDAPAPLFPAPIVCAPRITAGIEPTCILVHVHEPSVRVVAICPSPWSEVEHCIYLPVPIRHVSPAARRSSLRRFGLLNCSRRLRGSDLGPSLAIGGSVISPSDHHRFLGVLLDSKLRFHQHVSHALAKGDAWVSLIRRLSRLQYGLSLSLVKRLYLAVAVPSMLYAADTFLTPARKLPGQRRMHGSVGAIKKLGRVQRQALLVMTGGMRTTATDVMEAHADVLPFPLLVDKLCQRAAVRLCTLPKSHPLSPHVSTAKRRFVKFHRSALHELLHAYEATADPARMEKILPCRRHPRWTPKHSIEVEDSKIAALGAEERWARRSGLRVYSDGSDVDGGVGAAAVLVRPGGRPPRILQLHLGPSDEHSVPEAEVVGLILGAELIRQERRQVKRASIALDNRGAPQASLEIASKPGQGRMAVLHRTIGRAHKAHNRLDLTIRWVPGHLGVDGNELADDAAKEAARGCSSSMARLPAPLRQPLPVNASKARQSHLAALREQAAQRWRLSKAAAFSLRRSLPICHRASLRSSSSLSRGGRRACYSSFGSAMLPSMLISIASRRLRRRAAQHAGRVTRRYSTSSSFARSLRPRVPCTFVPLASGAVRWRSFSTRQQRSLPYSRSSMPRGGSTRLLARSH